MFNGSGIGNQLLNYVSVRCLALDKGCDFGVVYPERFKGHSFMSLDMGHEVHAEFPVEGQPPTQLPEGHTYYREKTVLNEHGVDVSPVDEDFKNLPDNTMIHGLLQSEEYFKHRKSEIDQWLKVEPLEMADDVCVINFRGGEYKFVPEFFLPQSYWDNAIEIMREKHPDIKFEVHTDDKEWARHFFPDFPIYKDIALNWRSIRYAKHLILSNSTFAILPAFLNEGVEEIIAPKYFGRYNRGYWQLPQNIYAGWQYLDIYGNLEICKS
jgi:hypothetical protein